MIPRAFRIRDFRSIVDTGECTLSGDGITALAGQNEAGKTAVLTALRDFDLEMGKPPLTEDFMPDNDHNAKPRVSVMFEIDVNVLEEWLVEDNYTLPSDVLQYLHKHNNLWITRDLRSATFTLEKKIIDLWPPIFEVKEQIVDEVGGGDSEIEKVDSNEEASAPTLLSPEDFPKYLHQLWPAFVYFDTFGDTLPREVELEVVSQIRPESETSAAPSITVTEVKKNAPGTVQDFITLSGLSLETIALFANEDKKLRNYLDQCSASISGDFLTYWKQATDGEETAKLQVRHMRSNVGKLQLQFYVHDQTDQYPEQRSKGFLWFLSFYLRGCMERDIMG
jgi:hypothetical protein